MLIVPREIGPSEMSWVAHEMQLESWLNEAIY
jgi:hypothetical protein